MPDRGCSPRRAQVEFQLACPKRFVVGGLDAELSSRDIDIGFVGNLGSPGEPGHHDVEGAVFLGRLVRGRDPAASFRPHIGCVPASGGGQRTPTAYHPFKPGKPSVRHVTQFVVQAGRTRHYLKGCAQQREPRCGDACRSASSVTSRRPLRLRGRVQVAQSVHAGRVTLTIRATRAIAGGHAVVQLDLVCAPK